MDLEEGLEAELEQASTVVQVGGCPTQGIAMRRHRCTAGDSLRCWAAKGDTARSASHVGGSIQNWVSCSSLTAPARL